MKKPFLAWLLGIVMALGGGALARGEDLADQYFTAESPRLTAQEQAALALAKRWEGDGATGMAPVAGPDGAIRFLFGAQQPSIVCAVLQVCDVALQPGELVNSIHLGDTARWTVEPAITGSGAGEIQHLIIKPMDVGLETSLVVTTTGAPITCGCAPIAAPISPRWPSPTRRKRKRNGRGFVPKRAKPVTRAPSRQPVSRWTIWILTMTLLAPRPGSRCGSITTGARP